MSASVHPVQGGVQGGVQGRNPRHHWLGQGVQGSALHGRTRTNANCAIAMHVKCAARTRVPLHPLHALPDAGRARVSGVQGGVQGQTHPAPARARMRAFPFSPFPESEGRGAQL